MPSLHHEVLVGLFDARPALGAELLERALGLSLPPFCDVTTGSTNLGASLPASYHADVVLRFLDARGADVLGLIVEVQLRKDPRKRRSWPAYVVNLARMLGCPVELLVLAPDPVVARWAREPIPLTLSGCSLTPLVVDFPSMPLIVDAGEALRSPELSLLSTLAHGSGAHGARTALATLLAAAGLDEERQKLYLDLVYSVIDEDAQAVLEESMRLEGYEWQSELVRRHREEGREEGRLKGRSEGVALGLAQAIVAVLEGRGVAVSADEVSRIDDEHDPETLRRWLERALHVAAAHELFSNGVR